jgi:N4-gp56 family major capsid protein
MADIITVSSGTAGAAGSTAAEQVTYINAKMLDVAILNTVLRQFGEIAPMPDRSSKTMRFTRLEKFSVPSSPSQLVEGIPPDADPLTISQVEATVEQYGKLVRISEIAELTAKHPLIEATVNRLGLHAAELYDQLIYSVLDAATNNYRPNSKAGDTALTAADQIGYVDLIELDAILLGAGGRPFGSEYVLITSPQPYAGMLKDPDFKASVQLAAPERMWRGEVNMLGGFRVVRSNSPGFAVTSQAGSGQASRVYSSFALAQNAYQVIDLQNLEVSVVPPGGHGDPLKQSYKLGYKFMFKAVITNQNWIRRVRSAGLDSVTNP